MRSFSITICGKEDEATTPVEATARVGVSYAPSEISEAEFRNIIRDVAEFAWSRLIAANSDYANTDMSGP